MENRPFTGDYKLISINYSVILFLATTTAPAANSRIPRSIATDVLSPVATLPVVVEPELLEPEFVEPELFEPVAGVVGAVVEGSVTTCVGEIGRAHV